MKKTKRKRTSSARPTLPPAHAAAIAKYERDALGAIAAGHTHHSLEECRIQWTEGHGRDSRLGEIKAAVGNESAALDAALERLRAAWAERWAAMPKVMPGTRIYDHTGNASGIVLAADHRTVLLVSDANEFGCNELSLCNLSDVAIAEEVDVLDRQAWHALVDRYMDMAAVDRVTVSGRASDERIRADQFRTHRSVDVAGTPLHIGDRVEVLNEPESGGVIIAVADDVALMMNDWTVGSSLSHGVLYKNSNELRVLPDVHGRVIEFVNARLPAVPATTANPSTGGSDEPR